MQNQKPITGTITWTSSDSPDATQPEDAPPAARVPSAKLTVNLPADVIDAAKAAYWLDLTRGGEHQRFGSWVAQALRDKIEATKTQHRVDALPPYPKQLPTGRPLA